MLNKDFAATAAAQFQDRRSKVLLDGRCFLFGKDKTELRRQVYQRDEGRCVDCHKFTGWDFGQMSHFPRRPLGGDSLQTCSWRCAACHHLLDGKGMPMHY